MKLSDFNYNLPQELIAQYPLEKRAEARLLVLNREEASISHLKFHQLTNFLEDEDVLVLNNTKVFKARLKGNKETGGKVEILLIRELRDGVWETMISHAKRTKESTKIFLEQDIYAIVMEKEGSRCKLKFNIPSEKIIKKYGFVPLPHYIRRNTVEKDEEYYQSVFAKKQGSIAAPTAGLHFTKEILRDIKKRGTTIVELTLHIGPGTFKSIKTENVEEHSMEPEYFEIPDDTIQKIKHAKRVFGVGTSVCRALESCANTNAKSGRADLFIYPGFEFKIVDSLITNFHLPCSTPLLLVCAFAGKDQIFKAYDEAIQRKYRFLSYGDAMLIV